MVKLTNMQCTDFNTSEDLIALLQPIGATWFSSGGIPGKTPNIIIILLGHCLVILFHISPFHTGINRLGVDTEYYSILLNSSIDDHLGAYIDHLVLATSIEHGNMMIAIQGNISSGGLPL